jgi:hypothetical protein
VVPTTDEGDRAAISDAVTRAIAQVSKATARPVPDDLEIVFHPTTQSFTRQTGESWWSAARTRGHRIDLQPPSVLNDRGTLSTTLRHEIAHVVTEPVLQGRAMWVREGAAMHFAGEPPPTSLLNADGTIQRVTCPGDLDLQRPVSAALARQAYGRAAACFERAFAEAGDWTRVK